MEKPTFESAVLPLQSTIKTIVAKTLTNKNNVDDITQDTLLVAHQNWDKFDPSKTPVQTWLVHLARRTALAANAKEAQEPEI